MLFLIFLNRVFLFFTVLRRKLWKILKEMEILDQLICLLRNLYAGQDVTVTTGHGTMDLFKVWKWVPQGSIFSLCLFNLYAEYIMRNNVGNLICSSSAFCKFSLFILKFLVHILLKPSLKDFEHYLTSMRNERNCVVVWTFFGIALLWYWDENWHFPGPLDFTLQDVLL